MAEELIAGRYRLLEPLGRGAMSSVWEAEDEELARRVAVKMLAPSAERQRFEREARAAAALSHPNIVSLYDYGDAGGRPFMVLECLTGGSLEDRLRDGKALPDDEVRRIALDVAAGLAHAHERGLVHRDLKPANILFDSEGRAKIADFGIARMGGTTLTEAGTVLGTASYISPEQATGAPAGPPSDVYSFGVIVFRMLTGRLPFVSSNAMELVRLHRDAEPPAVSELREDAPPALAALAADALAKDSSARPRDGQALLAVLRGDETMATLVGAHAVAAAESEPTEALTTRRRRNPLLAAAVVAALLLLGGAALAVGLTRNDDGSGGGAATSTAPGLSLPAVTTEPSTSTAAASTTTAPATTTAPSTTEPTTSTAPTTTRQRTTTTAPTTTAPTTATLPTTTAPTTTASPTTTDTTPTTTDVTTTTP